MRWILVIVAAIAACGCGSMPKPQAIQDSFDVAAPYDQVWSAVIETFAENSWPISTIEKASGLIATDWLNFFTEDRSQYCDCGGAGLLVEVDRLGKFNVFVKEVDSGCQMRVNVTFQGSFAFGSGTPTKRQCYSRGVLEKRIFDAVNGKLAHQAAAP